MKEKKVRLQRLFKYMHPYKLRLINATFFTLLNNVFDILPDAVIGMAIDVIVNQGNSFLTQLGIITLKHQLYLLGFLVFFTWFGGALSRYLSEYLWGSLAYILQHTLRVEAYAKVQTLPMEFFEYTDSNDIASILSEDINSMEEFVQDGIRELIKMVAGVIIMGVIVFLLSPIVAIFTFASLPFIFLVMYIFQKKLAVLYALERGAAAEMSSRLMNNIGGMRAIKSYLTETFEAHSINKFSKNYQEKNINALSVTAAAIPVVTIIFGISFVMTLIFGGIQVLEGTLNIGAFTMLISMVQQLLWPFTQVAEMSHRFEQDMACADRVFEIIDAPQEKCAIEFGEIPMLSGEITFENVNFSYPNGQQIFEDFNLSIPAGQTVAFVGETGSGKSTIIKLLLRLYEVSGGTIKIDGIPINTMSCISLRKQVALVSQESFLFEGTIAENIAYGTFSATKEEIIRSAEYAEIDKYINSLPKKYDTFVASSGAMFSGGQRQRIAVARALLKDAPIFIFDEATAILDNETELEIQKSLEKVSADHTTIIIAHRLSTVRKADIIYVLEEGKIIESGTHEELLKKNGEYAALWDIQIGN